MSVVYYKYFCMDMQWTYLVSAVFTHTVFKSELIGLRTT
jgi:hypothetical protein